MTDNVRTEDQLTDFEKKIIEYCLSLGNLDELAEIIKKEFLKVEDSTETNKRLLAELKKLNKKLKEHQLTEETK